LIELGVVAVFGLIPDFPIVNVEVEAVRPTLVVMADDMLTNSRPLSVILGRVDAICLDMGLILNRDSQSEIRLHTVFYEALNQFIGKCKIVGRRIVFIGIKVSENIGNIDIAVAAKCSSYVMKTRIGNIGIF
jgi:hypothetical protein